MTWRLPDLEGRDLDDPATTVVKKEVVRRKPFLNRLYRSFYGELLAFMREAPPGPAVELGSGPGFMKEVEPALITSDVISVPGLDLRFSAGEFPFKNGSLSCIVMTDVFHHLPDPLGFLREAQRCLIRGGRVVMIEPCNSRFGRWVYRNLHHEPFDPEGDWTPPGDGPLSRANIALPWIVFSRDRERLGRELPRMRLKTIRPHTPFAYLLSGGVSYRAFLPGFFFGPVRAVEWILSPFMKQIAMFETICLEKE